jgi:hypothetical protein
MTFRLAPMSGLIAALTAVVLLVPLFITATALGVPGAKPALLVAAALLATYAFTWLYMRPRAFVIADDGLDVVWPLRRRRYPWADVAGASVVPPADLRGEFGVLLRVGVGGLWGGFGLAWSSRGKHLGLYVSRHADGLVLVRCHQGRSLLITPENPDAFVAAVAARSGATGVR